jgi:hypothetical protein
MKVARTLVALSAVACFALAGCTGNAATVAGQGYQSGTQSKSITCGSAGTASGTVAYGEQGIGKLHVKVTDGKGSTIHETGGNGANMGQSGGSQAVHGEAGTWTLAVDTGIGFAGQWAITLSC